MKKFKQSLIALTLLGAAGFTEAAEYTIDTDGAHAFVQFRVKHMGFSWLYGRFNDFEGKFTWDKNDPKKNAIEVTVDVTSLDSNHEKRDLHIRSDDFLDARKFKDAKFVSTAYKATGDTTAEVTGDLTLHGKTKPITVDVEFIGEGKDPWGGYRAGFEGRATIKPEQWGIPMTDKLGASSAEVELMISVEGVRKN